MDCGGGQRVAANLANYWASMGWEITLVTIASHKYDFYVLNPTIRRIALGLEEGHGEFFLVGLRRTLRRIMALRRVLKQVQPRIALGIMHTNIVILAIASLGVPNLIPIGSEQIYPPREPLKPSWERLRSISYRWLSAVVALTNEGAVWLKNHTRAVNVPVIPSAVIWPLPIQPPIVNPTVLLPPDRRVLLAVGRLAEQKHFGHLIEVFGALAPDYPEWQLVILGDGHLRTAIESQVKEQGLLDRVLLPGLAGNMADWYERADLYVMSSLFEGFPNTLAEAMAHGLPVISYDCDTGPRDLIRQDIDGLLVPPGSTDGLKAALARLMSDEAMRARFAKRAIEARERFSMQRISGMWEHLFTGLEK